MVFKRLKQIKQEENHLLDLNSAFYKLTEYNPLETVFIKYFPVFTLYPCFNPRDLQTSFDNTKSSSIIIVLDPNDD
jgi:hypothetical protein